MSVPGTTTAPAAAPATTKAPPPGAPAARTAPATTATSTTTPPASTSAPTATQTPPQTAPQAAPDALAKPKAEPAEVEAIYGKLARKEKALFEREKALGSHEKRAKELDAVLVRAKDDPAAAFDALATLLGVPDLFDRAASARVSRKKVDPTASKALGEVEQLRRELQVERAVPLLERGVPMAQIAEHIGIDADALQALASDKAVAAKFSRATEAYNASIEEKLTQHDSEIQAWVSAEKEADGSLRYEMISTFGAAAKVFQLIAQHHAETLAEGKPEVLTAQAAADIIEEQLLKHAQSLQSKFTGARKLQPGTPPVPSVGNKASQTPESNPPVTRPPTTAQTLSNAAAQDTSESAREPSEKERLASAARVLGNARRARSQA